MKTRNATPGTQAEATNALAAQKQTNEFIVNQYNHGTTILALGGIKPAA